MMLDDLAIFNKGSLRDKVGQMLLLERIAFNHRGPFGVDWVDLMIRKNSNWYHRSFDSEVNGYSKYLVGLLINKISYSKLNDEMERIGELYGD